MSHTLSFTTHARTLRAWRSRLPTRRRRRSWKTPPAFARTIDSTLARVMDSDGDPATFDERGYFPAILAMANLARASAATFFPAVYRPTKRWRPARVVDALSRTLVRATDVN